MTPVIPCSISNVALIPGTAFISRKNNRSTRCNFLGKSTKQTLSLQRSLFPLSTSLRLFPNYGSGDAIQSRSRVHMLAATGAEVAIEEPNSSVAGEDADETSELPTSAVETSEAPTSTADVHATPTAQPKRSRPIKSEMPPVKNEELVPGATFMGKVRSVLPFGAFVDFGAFTDGLVHVSRLSDSFVKDVGSIVSVGQEVKVRLVEANTETGRISLTMRDSDDISKLQQQQDAPASSDKPRPSRRNTSKSNQTRDKMQKSSKFVKGQDLEGTVKNLTRAGAFISLPEGEEGFLPTSEESVEGFGNLMGGSSLQAGQEVSVRVLRITRGQVTLTMKREEDNAKLDSKLSQGMVHVATNPFLLAFRKNKDIAAFLDERERVKEVAETSEERGKVNETETKSETPEVQDQSTSSDEGQVSVPSAVDEVVEDVETSSVGVNKEVELASTTVDAPSTELTSNDEPSESTVFNSSQSVDAANETIQEEGVSSETLTAEESVSSVNQITEQAPVTDGVKEDEKPNSAGEIGGDQISSLVIEEVVESQADDAIIKDEVVTQAESMVSEEVVESQADDAIIKDEVQTQAPPNLENKIPSATADEDEKAGPIPEKNGNVITSSAQTDISSPQESTTKARISPALVKQLREETGAGMMDCKNALAETEGDIVKAQEFLRKKGLASADKKSSRATAEGRIGSYIHDSRIGVLIEVNCETDFVSRGDIFKDLVDDLAMQVAACPQVQYLVTDDVAEETVNKEREIEMQKEDLLSKPEQIRSKIVEGRIRKRLEELALLEQPYIKNDKVVVKDWVKQTIATIGENIKVKRFVRYNLGEGLEKKRQDFAAEVAAQTTAKLPAASGIEQSAAVEAKEIVEKPPTVTVSAALVKQLREETGAGMMDCKKALAETGGDLEKAQEYLRKKGLSSADKKSSRLAAEGRIGSYIHDSRIGVLIEVNCETDFVGRSEKFKELVDDLAMQVVACPQVQFVSIEEIPASIVSKEKELEMQREDLQSKPENIREKIVEGRISKRLGELVLLEQPFVKNDSILVKDLVKQTVAALGENIKVRRFIRFTLGEVIENSETETEA
ncbi:hypothetical protein HHK36_014145 [Tetracentron sinense]|uniref:Elongation factor Ts, mitochondrial n=1 Tax=Tetracentron sinense TaxID=13715 RepID=A0A834Z7G9_TETSI|nr:hypothetical protein HHK36_014145 [Tetracentron sinense]